MSGRRDGIGNGFCVISAAGWDWALFFEAHGLFGHGVGLVHALHRRGSCRCGCGEMDVIGTQQVAALALKPCCNKNGSQHIVLFVGSAFQCADRQAFVKAGK